MTISNSISNSKCSLFLHPVAHNFFLEDIQAFTASLQKISLISHTINEEDTHDYFTGDKYLDYIAYMGCAPTIQFEASESNLGFCFIKIHNDETAKLIHSQQQAKAPLCPNCKKPAKNWQHKRTETIIKCTQCGKTINIDDFNWRKMAGYARLFIEISDIYPKEALPQQSLLDKLADITGAEWSYFYSCQ